MNLRELSAHLGLSQTTVSRALNGYPEVSERTRLRVQEAAREQGYAPNARAKGLATGRANAIGHVIPVANQHEMVNPIFGDFIAGAGEVYGRAGIDMVLSMVADADEADHYRKLRAKHAVDGVILHGPLIEDRRIALLEEIGMPFVVHGRSSGMEKPYAWCDVNNGRAFARATEFLLDLGHRRIVLVNGLEHMDYAYRRRLGYLSALKARDVAVDDGLMFSEEMTESYGHRVAAQLLASDTPPTAFLVSSLICAIGARRAIEERGLRMGRDVSIVTHDDALSYLRNGDAEPIFTATRSSVREAGRLSAEALLRMIANPSKPPPTILLEAELMVGGSTGPAPQEAAPS